MKLLYLECSLWPHRKFMTKMRQIVNYVTIWKRYQENNCFQSALVWCWGGLGRDCHSSPGDCNCNNLHHCCLCRNRNDHQHPCPVTVIIFAIAVTIVFVFVNSIAMVVILAIVMFINIIVLIVVTTCPTWSEKRVGLLDQPWGDGPRPIFFKKKEQWKLFLFLVKSVFWFWVDCPMVRRVSCWLV